MPPNAFAGQRQFAFGRRLTFDAGVSWHWWPVVPDEAADVRQPSSARSPRVEPDIRLVQLQVVMRQPYSGLVYHANALVVSQKSIATQMRFSSKPWPPGALDALLPSQNSKKAM